MFGLVQEIRYPFGPGEIQRLINWENIRRVTAMRETKREK